MGIERSAARKDLRQVQGPHRGASFGPSRRSHRLLMSRRASPTRTSLHGPGAGSRYRLAASAIHGDLAVFVPEEARLDGQVVRKSAIDRRIEVDPSVRTYFVEMEPSTLHDPLGYDERSREALRAHDGLHRPLIDDRVLVGLGGTLRAASWKVSRRYGREGRRLRWCGLRRAGCSAAWDPPWTSAPRPSLPTCATSRPGRSCLRRYDEPAGVLWRGRDEPHPPLDVARRRRGEAAPRRRGGANALAARVAEAAGRDQPRHLEMAVASTRRWITAFSASTRRPWEWPPTRRRCSTRSTSRRATWGSISARSQVFVLPYEAGFVGVDNVWALIAEERWKRDERQPIVDIGTNGELIMGDGRRLISRRAPWARCSRVPRPSPACARLRAPSSASPISPENRELRYWYVGKDAWSDELPPEMMGGKGICGRGSSTAWPSCSRPASSTGPGGS